MDSDYCGSIKESWVFSHRAFCSKKSKTEPLIDTLDGHYLLIMGQVICTSPIFLDLYDDINQHDYYTPCPDDEVTGYTPALLNTLLIHTHTLLSLKTKVKQNKPNGVTDEMINTLFNVYEANWIE